MTRTIDIPTYQTAVVRNCSPTLAGIKPASLFTYPGVYATKTENPAPPYRRATLSPARRHSPMQPRAPATRNPYERFGLAPLRSAHLCVSPCGPHAIPLRPPCHDGASAEGYDVHNLPASLVHLAARITLASSNAAESAYDGSVCALARNRHCDTGCMCEFPHEIGYFLGYPYEDVHQFIVQHGENYKVFGAWKVYTNVEQALTTFDSYRACTQYLTYIYQQGCTLEQLVQATR